MDVLAKDGIDNGGGGDDVQELAASHRQNDVDRDGSAALARPLPPRSLDDFLEAAAAAASGSDDADGRGLLPRWCDRRRRPWRYWSIFFSLGVANSSDATEILCLSYVLSEPSFQDSILQRSEWRGGLVAATVFLGMLLGGLLVGAMGDRRHGRKPALISGLVTNCAAGFLSAGATDAYSLAALRFAAGLGIGATVPPLFTLCSELSPQRDRGFWVTVAAGFWMVGSVYVALAGLWLLRGQVGGSSSWRVFAAVCALPSALGCLMVWFHVPESPRFLALRGHYDRAAAVAQRLANDLLYDSGPPLTGDELRNHYRSREHEEKREEEEASERDLDTSTDGLLVESSAATATAPGRRTSLSLLVGVRTACADFSATASPLYTSHLRATTLPLQLVWFTLNFGSYGLMTWINTLFVRVHLQDVYFNALLFAASNLPGNLLSAALMDRVGRSRLLVASIAASAISLGFFAYVAYEPNRADADADADADAADEDAVSGARSALIVLAACSFQCFIIAAWNAIDVMTSELFPTAVRATGMGLCAATGRVGAMAAQLVNGWLVTRPVRLLLTAASTLLVGALCAPCLPDMTGQAVEDLVRRQHLTAAAAAPSATSSGCQRGSLHISLPVSPRASVGRRRRYSSPPHAII